MLARIARGVAHLREQLAAIAYRMQLGPTGEVAWRAFMPRH